MTTEPFDALGAVLARIDPATVTHRDATAQAFQEAGADLQECRHQLQAAELGNDEQAEATALVRLRRTERKYTDAEQQNQQAQQAYGNAFVAAWRAVRDVEYPAADAWQVEAEQRVLAAYQAVKDLDGELGQQYQRLIAERITPLQRIAEQLRLPASEWMPNHQGKYA